MHHALKKVTCGQSMVPYTPTSRPQVQQRISDSVISKHALISGHQHVSSNYKQRASQFQTSESNVVLRLCLVSYGFKLRTA